MYGPIGLLSYLRDTAPSFVQAFVVRGRKEFDTVRRNVDARRAACMPSADRDQAVARVRERVTVLVAQAGDVLVQAAEVVASLRPTAARSGAPTPTTTAPSAPADTTTSAEPKPATADAAANAPVAPVVSIVPEPELPIADYDGLAAPQVVARLDGLDRRDLERIREYEAAHRGRRTILSKIDQLLG